MNFFKKYLLCLILFFPLQTLASGPMIRVLLTEDVLPANINIMKGDGRTWVDGVAYKGEITIRKSADQKLSLINTLPLEDYLFGILRGEMPADWPEEALKAQAVVSRTYAYSILNEKSGEKEGGVFDVKATVEDQVYQGDSPLEPKAAKAVSDTAGEVITHNGKLTKTRFHSACGGETEVSMRVWGESDVSRRLKDPYCANSPNTRWSAFLSSAEINGSLKKYGFDPGLIDSITTEPYANSGRVAAVSIHGKNQTISLTGNDFRRYLGFSRIKSTLFSVKKQKNGFSFSGRGFGHGVGMCQWGAKGMAEKGFSYRDILGFYYPDTDIILLPSLDGRGLRGG